MRECGNCSLCCKVLPIMSRSEGGNDDFPFDKPAGEWCKHCSPGNGCKVFNQTELPSLCKNYECMWRREDLPLEHKPSRVHAIFDQVEVGGMPYVLITTDPNYPVHPDVRLLLRENRGRFRMMLRTAETDELFALGDTWEEEQQDIAAFMAARQSKYAAMKAAGLIPASAIAAAV